jgi:PEP-CTERM motif-containing protein
MRIRYALLAVLAVGLFSAPVTATPFTVSVGYADGLRGVGFFPTPWDGDPTVALFAGTTASGPDEGAILVTNTGGSSLTINDVKVTLSPGTAPTVFQLWGAFLGGSGFSLAPGDSAIFTATANYNFDSSDFPFTDFAHNCVTSPTPDANCGADAPQVDVTIDSVLNSLVDSGHVLDTEGFDFATIGNESFAWRPIGTVGGPAGVPDVPEPATLTLLGGGILGLARSFRRRRA